MLDHVENTFVTPVFNGSASLRDAAGQLIENVTKSVKRKETVDNSYIENLFADVSSLYRLDQIGGRASISVDREELGELPAASVALLSILAIAWILILFYVLFEAIRKKRM